MNDIVCRYVEDSWPDRKSELLNGGIVLLKTNGFDGSARVHSLQPGATFIVLAQPALLVVQARYDATHTVHAAAHRAAPASSRSSPIMEAATGQSLIS